MDTLQTSRYDARGFVDDVTTCEICGKEELKGTVRLVIVDADGNDDGEVYAGVVCASRRAGRPAKDIRKEALTAEKERDQAVRALWFTWRDAKSDYEIGLRDAAVPPSWSRTPREIRTYFDTDEHKAAMAVWRAEHPEPPRPAGY